MEERPGRIVLDENTGMLLWQYEDDGSYVPLEVYADRIYVTGHIPKESNQKKRRINHG